MIDIFLILQSCMSPLNNRQHTTITAIFCWHEKLLWHKVCLRRRQHHQWPCGCHHHHHHHHHLKQNKCKTHGKMKLRKSWLQNSMPEREITSAKPGWMRYPLCGSTQETAGCCHCHWVCWDCCQYSCCCSCCSCCCCMSSLACCSSIFAAICFCCLPWILWNLAPSYGSKPLLLSLLLSFGWVLLPHFGQPLSLHIAAWSSAAAWCSSFFWPPLIFFPGGGCPQTMHPGAFLPRTMATSFLPTHLLFLPTRHCFFFMPLLFPPLLLPALALPVFPSPFFPGFSFLGIVAIFFGCFCLPPCGFWVVAATSASFWWSWPLPAWGRWWGLPHPCPCPFQGLAAVPFSRLWNVLFKELFTMPNTGKGSCPQFEPIKRGWERQSVTTGMQVC